jgi:peptidoglycan/xylan/chitin deacetylase (PgdA/CDA1 family)
MKRAIILMYHIVDNPRDTSEEKYCCSVKNFERQMRYLRQSAFSPVSLDIYISSLRNNSPIPDNPIVITFDDGFEDFYRNAFPAAQKHDIPLTLFMVTEGIGGTNKWMHQRGKPKRKLLNQNELLSCAKAGVTIGSHTLTHPRLTEVDDKTANNEIKLSKMHLQDILQQEVKHFAYPYGLYDPNHLEIIEEAGYESACSTRSGFNRNNINLFELRRIEVYGSDTLWHFKQKLKFGTNDMTFLYPAQYYIERIMNNLTGKNNNVS